MKNLFDSATLLLDRARENREEFHRRCQAFFDSNPYATVVELDPHSGYYVRKARFTDRLPDILSTVAADAFNNLRHALDQAICASALAMDSAVDLKGVSFAFGKTVQDFEQNARSTRNKVAPDIVAAMRNLQPYKGGNDRLWGLNNLCAHNKHRGLIAIGAEVQQININTMSLFTTDPIFPPVWDNAKNELLIAASMHPDKLVYNLDVEFFVALGEVEIFHRHSAIGIIDYLTLVVGAILTGIESDTIRLFPASFS
jgi:hypothetical protein